MSSTQFAYECKAGSLGSLHESQHITDLWSMHNNYCLMANRSVWKSSVGFYNVLRARPRTYEPRPHCVGNLSWACGSKLKLQVQQSWLSWVLTLRQSDWCSTAVLLSRMYSNRNVLAAVVVLLALCGRYCSAQGGCTPPAGSNLISDMNKLANNIPKPNRGGLGRECSRWYAAFVSKFFVCYFRAARSHWRQWSRLVGNVQWITG